MEAPLADGVQPLSLNRTPAPFSDSSRTRVTSDRAINPLPLLTIARDKAIAISLTAGLIPCLRSPCGQCRIQLGSSQPCFPAPVDQRTMVHGCHILAFLSWVPRCLSLPASAISFISLIHLCAE